jgi:AcrR family transcriptional regulator
MERAAVGPRQIGRPREARADRAILAATLQLIAERGVADVRMDDIADAAGVGKAAIYRRYRSKEELVAAAVAGLVGEIAVPDTGSTRGDLLALMHEATDVYGRPVAARAMPALVAAMSRNPDLATAVRGGFLAVRRAALQEVLDRGVERGDLRPDLDFELALDVLGGPLFYRLLITGGPIDEALAVGVVELILSGFGPDTARGAKSQTARRGKPQ